MHHALADIFVLHQNQEWRHWVCLSKSCSLKSGTGERGGVQNVEHGNCKRKMKTLFFLFYSLHDSKAIFSYDHKLWMCLRKDLVSKAIGLSLEFNSSLSTIPPRPTEGRTLRAFCKQTMGLDQLSPSFASPTNCRSK